MTEAEMELLVQFVRESEAIENDPTDMKGHAKALLMLHDRAGAGKLIDSRTIKLAQKLIVEGQPDDDPQAPHFIPRSERGVWRTMPVTAGGQSCPDAYRVPRLMEKLFDAMREWQMTVPRRLGERGMLHEIARFHHRFLKIHPFADGNGRTARALVYYLCYFAKFPPIVFTCYDKTTAYYPACAAQDPHGMEEYFLAHMFR